MKRFLSIILSVLLIAALFTTGCGKKATPDGGGTDKTAEEEGVNTGKISWQKDTSPVTFTTYIDFDWYALDTWGNDDVSKEITKRTGVSLEVTKSSDLNQLQVLLAADELPEIIFTSNLVDRFQNEDVSYPFDELIKKHCPEFMESIDPVEIANNTVDDGHFYTLKSHYNSQKNWEDPRNLPSPGNTGFYYRQDIMDAIGNPPMDSLDDLLSIYKTVKEKYPDMIVYIPHPQWSSPFAEFMGIAGNYVDTDGKVRSGYNNPAYLDWFKYMNTLYRSGYVTQESFTYKPEQFFQIEQSGKAFSASYNAGLADTTNKIFDDQGKNNHFLALTKPLKVNGEIKFKMMDAGIGWASCFITKKNKNPERAIRYMQFLKSDEGDQLTQWGIEGKHYTLTPEGLLKRPEGFNTLKVQDTGIGPWYFMASGLGEGVAVSSGAVNNPKYAQSVELLKFKKKYYERNPILYFASPKADTDEYTINIKINDLFNNTKVSIICAPSEEEAVARFNKMMDDMRKIGLDQLEAYMTDSYNKAKVKYDKINK